MIALGTDVLVRYLVDDDAAQAAAARRAGAAALYTFDRQAARLANAVLLAEEGPPPDRGAGE